MISSEWKSLKDLPPGTIFYHDVSLFRLIEHLDDGRHAVQCIAKEYVETIPIPNDSQWIGPQYMTYIDHTDQERGTMSVDTQVQPLLNN